MSAILSTVALGILASAAPAQARRTRRSAADIFEQLPTSRFPSGSFTTQTTSSASSYVKCNATVSAKTESEAISSFTDLMVTLTRSWCHGHHDPMDRKQVDAQVSAIATLLLESKIQCEADGTKTMGCGSTWAGATTFAGAAYEAFASAYAESGTAEHCGCEVDVMANADAVVAGWGEVWAKLYAGLDDEACVSTGGSKKWDEVDRVKVKDCLSSIVLRYWVKASASLWYDGKCFNGQPAQCETCCVDADGKPIPDCDCEDYRAQCKHVVFQATKAKAKAEITSAVPIEVSQCSVTLTDVLNNVTLPTSELDEMFVESNDHDRSANTKAECEAISYGASFAAAVSAHASAVKGLVESTCNMAPDPTAIEDHATATALALAGVYNEAWTKCRLSGDDADAALDGGCAVATSFSRAFAEACASATADALADLTFGAGSHCDCDISARVISTALAEQRETIFALVEQQVTAVACTETSDGSQYESRIGQQCMVSSFADLFAQATASILLENECVSANKDLFCADECREYSTSGDNNPVTCLTECGKESDAAAQAIAEAVATITISNTLSCTERHAAIGDAFVSARSLEATAPLDDKVEL